MRTIFLASGILFSQMLNAQLLKTPLYSITNILLEPSLHKQVCISGMKYFNKALYLASERCPILYSVNPENGNIIDSINLSIPQNFEMEGMTSYKNKLYMVSENIAAVYQVNPQTGELKTVQISEPLPPKSKNGDGMEGIAANEQHKKFYLLRERTEDMTQTQIYTYSVEQTSEEAVPVLQYQSMIELPLENPQWRYSDICIDTANNRLICLKSYSKGKLRQQFLESMKIDNDGNLIRETLANIPVEAFSETSNKYKSEDFSMNLEGITIDEEGNIFIVSDNTSGKADCAAFAKEKTILLQLKKNKEE